MSEWVSEVGGWVGYWVSEWVSGWVSWWVGEWVGGWVGGWVSNWVGGWVGGWVGEWVGGWVGRWVGRWVSDWVGGWLGGLVGGWVSGWVSVWELWVSNEVSDQDTGDVGAQYPKCLVLNFSLRNSLNVAAKSEQTVTHSPLCPNSKAPQAEAYPVQQNWLVCCPLCFHHC